MSENGQREDPLIKPNGVDSDDDDTVCLGESFFINDNYELTTFTFGSHVLQLLCLQSASSITGILCSKFCRAVMLTDHNDEVLKILKKNIELHESSENPNPCAALTAEKLEWGNSDQLNQILQKHSEGFDLVLGADICFQQNSVPLLFNTVQQLLCLRGKKQCRFILAYVSRSKMMDVMVTNEAIQHGLKIHEVDGTRCVIANLEGVIYEIIL
ncbi:uncharacterized protein LOC112503443 isoform X2 [Cynara cardunculus var. scolymus]|uniref:uncharacterized protein LOC112503443 isoform X2 n=1 Tax=Cynara cardunculus var. scolymus TaxID=59895 RepID=UPI000D62FA5E|nr:uncharacterized protein LOC112503443 isoform X2 [Cynara cardunculus var. scolymus]